MEEKKDKKKGFFASLFTPKTCSCGVQIEELAENENPKKDLKKRKKRHQKKTMQIKTKIQLVVVVKII